MKNSTQNVVSLPMVKESITINSKKGLSKFNLIGHQSFFNYSIPGIFKGFLICLILSFTIDGVFADILVTGGKQKIPNTPGPVNNGSEIKLVNNTGMDMWDIKVILYQQGKFKTLEVNHGGVSDKYPSTVTVSNIHIKFTKAVKNGGPLVIKMTTTSPNDSLYIIPTDTLGADIMVNRDINPVAAVTPANNQPKGSKPTPLKGGKVTVHFDGSNFPSMVYVNESGQEICDLRISAAKKGNNAASKIDSVFVNDKKVFGAPPSLSSVHVYFPCVPVGGTIKVTVKVSGNTEIDSYIISPTNKDSADITGVDTLKKSIYDGGKPGKTIKLGSGTTSNRVSTTFLNKTEQDICDAYIKTDKPIKKVIVNGKEWKADSLGAQNGMIHVVCGTEPCIPDGQTMTVTIILQNGTISEYTIIPTSNLGNIITVANLTSGSCQFRMPNATSPFGIQGRSGSLVAINESCSPISQLVFTSPDPGITITGASSSLPSTFDSLNGTLTFPFPVTPGATLDVTYVLNQLLPYSPTDSFPYTTIDMFAPGSLPFDGWWFATASSCPSALNGAIDFTITQGTGPFTYLWSNGSTTEDLSGINAGTYTVTVSSGSGCMNKTIEVPSKNSLLEIIPINSWCNGANNGGAVAFVSDNSESLNYFWSNGATTQTIYGQGPGILTLTTNNGFGCSWTGTITLSDPTPVTVSGTTVKLSCNGNLTGAINIIPAGGNPPYRFKWNNGSTSQNRSAIAAGTYTTTITDGFGCSLTSAWVVKQPKVLAVTSSIVDVSCAGGLNGSVASAVTGGTKPYQYSWSNSMTTAAITGLSAGAYNLTVTDFKGCINSTNNATINQPLPMNINIMPVSQNQAMAQVFGGVPPYQFLWNTLPPQNTPFANGLQPGQTYTVTVMDAHNCVQTGMITMPLTRINNNLNNLEVTSFPNPTQGMITIRLNQSSVDNYIVSLLDVTGKVIYVEEMQMHSGYKNLDFSRVAKGIYTLKISGEGKLNVSKLVIN